jgi:O-antigen ligase
VVSRRLASASWPALWHSDAPAVTVGAEAVPLSTLPSIRSGRPGPLLAVGAGAAFTLVVALTLASRPPTPSGLAAVVLGGGAIVAFTVARYEQAVALGFLLLGVVRVEPAPSDALLAVAAALAAATGHFSLRHVPGWVPPLIAALLAVNVLSAAAAVDLGEALRFFTITLYLVVFAMWAASHLQTRARMQLAIGAYVIGAAAVAALAVLGLFAAYPGHAALLPDGGRAQGLFKDPNVFGPFLVPALLIALDEVVRPRLLGWRRSAAFAALAVLALGVVFAYSRAGWLNLGVALTVMLAVMAARRGGGRALAGATALVLGMVAVAAIVVAVSGSGGFLEERARLQAYDTTRFTAQRSGVELATEHPLGIGPGQFELVEPVSAHSLYVRALAEQGPLGLALLVALLGGTLALAARNAAAGRDAYGVGSAVLLGAWCGLLANSAFVDTLHWRHLWLVAALIWLAGARSP